MRTRRRLKKRGFFRKTDIAILGLLSLLAITTFVVIQSIAILLQIPVFQPVDLSSSSSFSIGQTIQIVKNTETSSANKLTPYENWIGNITAISAKNIVGKAVYTYTIRFANGDSLQNVREDDLQNAPSSLYAVQTLAQISDIATADVHGQSLMDFRGKVGRIENVQPNYSNHDGGYVYDLSFEDGSNSTTVTEADLKALHPVVLKEENTASQNNEALRQAFDYAREHPGTKFAFPSGQFTIGGSDTPEETYQQLPSDTQLYGNNTQLKIQGRVYWLGFATGVEATDGVKNFTMSSIDFVADDLVNGNQFMIMVNHGDNWQIRHNTFTMVHYKGSHIFDLGGLQNSTFDNNNFIGYAPDLTSISEIPANIDLHDYYAEAIQLDASDNSGVWDGGILQRLDEWYNEHNTKKHLSNNITISNNSFIPYTNETGEIVAYGASLGQHSSDVGQLMIHGNTFKASLVNRYWQSQTDWMMRPIHFPEKSADKVASYENIIE